jgi:ABC-2 type transport system ATP-binding protein
MATAPAIRIEGLAKNYGRVRALRGIDLQVAPGEIFGFLGPNGAGKTTTIRILMDFIRPTAGAASVAGHDCQRDTIEAHKRIAYVPSDPRFYDNMHALDFFDLVAGLRGGVDVAYRDELIERYKLNPTRRLSELSRGNRQKVALIQALMLRTEVLILDEPTTGLDPLMQELTMKIVRELAAEGTTVFFSSHLLPEAEEVCHRACILRTGELVKIFNVAEERRAAPQRARAVFAHPVAAEEFSSIAGVTVVSAGDSTLDFRVQGGIDALIKHLSAFEVRAFEARQATLEDLFLAYYDEAHAEDS